MTCVLAYRHNGVVQVSPEWERFGEIYPLEEAPELPEGVVEAIGEKEQLQKLQDSLRKAGYKQMNTQQLKP